MGKQGLNLDNLPKIKSSVAMVKDELLPEMRKGIYNATDLATEMGAPALVKSCNAGQEGTERMIKLLETLVDCGDAAAKEYEKVGEGLGA
jgi:hypothetical protein